MTEQADPLFGEAYIRCDISLNVVWEDIKDEVFGRTSRIIATCTTPEYAEDLVIRWNGRQVAE